MNVKIRYQPPEGGESRLLAFPVPAGSQPIAASSESMRWAAVAAWGMLLRDSPHRGDASWDLVQDLAGGARGLDPEGYRAELLRLVDLSERLASR